MNDFEKIKNVERGIITFDSDYTPELADEFPLITKVDKEIPFIIVEICPNESNRDPMISIIPDNVHNRDIISQSNYYNIIGSGISNIAIPALMYGLQHPTRILYKNSMSKVNEFTANMTNKFNEDDALLRGLLNNFSM